MTAITRALSAALLHFVWQGLGVTILLWLALFLLRKRSAALRYWASCAALALLVGLPAVTTWVLYEHPAATAPIAAAGWTLAPHPAAPAAPAGPGAAWLGRLETWTIPVWSCGVLLFSLRMAWGCTRIAGLRRRGEAADAGLLAAVSRLAARMGVARPVRVLLSGVTDSPSVTGWLRPVILLPLSALAGLTPDQLEAVLAHELAHIRRHDYLVNLLQMAAETVLFYHPAVWWISARIRHERELCCDDLAVEACGGALCYARALTALEKMRAGHPALALGVTDGPLFLRIRRLVAGGGEYGPSKLSGMIAISLGVACLALCVNWARGQEPMRGYAIIGASVEDGEGVTVDTAGAVVIHRTGVEYPHQLIPKHVEGTVSVEAILDATGNVIDAHVLSGPNELRKAALSSVLNWHFAPGSGNTRIVQIAFRTPAVPREPERKTAERKQGSVLELRAPATVTVRGPEGEAQTRELLAVEAQVESQRTAMTRRFLEEGLAQARERLARIQNQPDANAEDLAKARNQLQELEQKLAASDVVAAHAEERARERRPQSGSADQEKTRLLLERMRESMTENLRAGGSAGRKVASIEIRGLSDAAGNDLLSRLPVHEGDTLTQESMESLGRAIRQYDEHLEFSYRREGAGVVLRIHPAGAAGAPLLQRK